jgi:hypothetical protein
MPFFINTTAMRYSIVKSIITYKPQEIIKAICEQKNNIVELLKNFYANKIEENKQNLKLKERENDVFNELLIVLSYVNTSIKFDWNYEIAFWGFSEYLKEIKAKQVNLYLDEEGTGNTFAGARKNLNCNIKEVNSKDYFGVRMADLLAGLISKFCKAIHNALRSTTPSKKTLNLKWFDITEKHLEMYKKLHYILTELNSVYHKSFTGDYSDDILVLIELLRYFNKFKDINEIKKSTTIPHNEIFNNLTICAFENYRKRVLGDMKD